MNNSIKMLRVDRTRTKELKKNNRRIRKDQWNHNFGLVGFKLIFKVNLAFFLF